MTRRLPAPWSVRELEQAFVVSDANGRALAYTYFRKDENEARQAHVPATRRKLPTDQRRDVP